ncbi:ABC transporter ATP-binding protein [Hufsiella ginkgonis]|uniref:ATP-binding cassette domain-containing protein n=1 Tax=Hufsiella ginkgonis TaxID=2695274 RepID=A0A7K1Y2G7_9SPHI|nr:polysaccharide ABC transporter ATP-binding protein [Hufsiella ginkgonis]MXV17473.1 ATP-binding cassette domain-containing protein [Hufsiella ginkgonis]
MSEIAIKVENLSKAYQLGDFGTGTISRDLERWWARLRGKEDPFLTIGEVNDRTVKGGSDIVWSLRDISMEINQGDAVGIIGRNGAGKSTLLKILSRITSPTHGNIKIRGRIASLLEVGTGFHPELTGRENIFLNGAILGMRKSEIQAQFDAIVDFSGVERYVDTPVKRYSSGMYVRLAFAVAAHLRSEILVIDEVLAVGDVEFQKKCLGKMGDVSKGEGRTVLFVSHNMSAISTLCNNAIVLDNGQLRFSGDVETAVKIYADDEPLNGDTAWEGNEGDEHIRLHKTWVVCKNEFNFFQTDSDLEIGVNFEVLKPVHGLIVGFTLYSEFGYELAYVQFDDRQSDSPELVTPGVYSKRFVIPGNTLAIGTYRIMFDLGIHMIKRIITAEGSLNFSLENVNGLGRRYQTARSRGRAGIFRPDWAVEK